MKRQQRQKLSYNLDPYSHTPYKIVIDPPPQQSFYGKQQRSSSKKKGISLIKDSTNINRKQQSFEVNKVSGWCGKQHNQQDLITIIQYPYQVHYDKGFFDNTGIYPIELQSRVIKPNKAIQNFDIKKFIQGQNQSQLARSVFEQNQSLNNRRSIVQRRCNSTTQKTFKNRYQTPDKQKHFQSVLNSNYNVKLNSQSFQTKGWQSYGKKRTQGHTQNTFGFKRSMRKMQETSYKKKPRKNQSTI